MKKLKKNNLNEYEDRLKIMNKILENKGYLSNSEVLLHLKNLGAQKNIETTKFAPGPLKIKDLKNFPEMTLIEGGIYSMGSNIDEDIWAQNDEKPPHSVTIKPFFISTYLVTQLEWFAIMGTMPSEIWGRYLPVTNVSWKDSQNFVEKLSEISQKKYRLPTESEWEFCSRSNTSTKFHHGNDEDQLSLYTCFGSDRLKAVGKKLPNQFGLYDMHGLTEQWVQDCWHDNYKGAPTDGSAWIEPESIWKVCRGSSWKDKRGSDLRSAKRSYYSLTQSMDYNGLRIARD